MCGSVLQCWRCSFCIFLIHLCILLPSKMATYNCMWVKYDTKNHTLGNRLLYMYISLDVIVGEYVLVILQYKYDILVITRVHHSYYTSPSPKQSWGRLLITIIRYRITGIIRGRKVSRISRIWKHSQMFSCTFYLRRNFYITRLPESRKFSRELQQRR